MSERTPRLYGHRGANRLLPENTIEAFNQALEDGATALESDVHITADGVVVLSHDPDGERTAGVPQRIVESTFDEVKTWDAGFGFVDEGGERPHRGRGFRVPSLIDALASFPDVRFNLDVKQIAPSMVAPLIEQVRKAGAEDRVLLTSFHTPTVRAILRAGYGGETGCGKLEIMALATLPVLVLRGLGLTGRRAQVPVRSGSFELGGRRFIDRCHQAGVRVDFWTINDATEAKRLLALGADGIMTDDVPAVVSAFSAHRKAP